VDNLVQSNYAPNMTIDLFIAAIHIIHLK